VDPLIVGEDVPQHVADVRVVRFWRIVVGAVAGVQVDQGRRIEVEVESQPTAPQHRPRGFSVSIPIPEFSIFLEPFFLLGGICLGALALILIPTPLLVSLKAQEARSS